MSAPESQALVPCMDPTSQTAVSSAATFFEFADSDVDSRTIRMSSFPASWIAVARGGSSLLSKLTNLLEKFGPLEQEPTIDKVDEVVVATAIFKDAAHAVQATETLHNVDNRTESEKRKANQALPREHEHFSVRLVSEITSNPGAPCWGVLSHGQSDMNSPSEDVKARSHHAHGANARDGVPFILYVDEFLRADGEVSESHKEIFVRDLPLEDYSEQDLHEWLEGFGTPERVYFCRDPSTQKLTGQGYVRFPTHAEAEGLLAAFPAENEEEDSVQGSWSMSERLLEQRDKIVPFISDRLSDIARACCVTELRLESNQENAPLRFLAWPAEDVRRNSKMLKELLEDLLEEVGANFTPRPTTTVSTSQTASAMTTRSAPHHATADSDLALPPETAPTSPCVIVRNLPNSWKESQVQIAFAVYGGVSMVRFFAGPGDDRVAHVELKVPDNMSKAVEQLHGTQVGDGELIEVCTMSLELGGVGSSQFGARRTGRRVVFIDELFMPKRPEVPAGPEDREVFLSSLPMTECDADQIKSWLQGFGEIEICSFMRNPLTNEIADTGYVRFRTHEQANACVEAMTVDAEEGDTMARWSESERASRKANCAYGIDLHNAFAGPSGRVLSSILSASKLKAQDLWMFSEQYPKRDRNAPDPEGKQLHFVANCNDDQFQELKSALIAALQNFHEKVSKRLRDQRDAAAAKERVAVAVRERETELHRQRLKRELEGRENAAKPRSQQSSPPTGWQGSGPTRVVSDNPPGLYGWQRPFPREGIYSSPPPGFFPTAGSCGHAFPGATPPGQHVPVEQSRSRSPAVGMATEITSSDPELQKRIEKGEKLVADGKAALAKGNPKKAYEKYCKGLQDLLDLMATLGENSQRTLALRLRINGYLDEAEKLKQMNEGRQLSDNACAGIQGSAAGTENANAAPTEVEKSAAESGERRGHRRHRREKKHKSRGEKRSGSRRDELSKNRDGSRRVEEPSNAKRMDVRIDEKRITLTPSDPYLRQVGREGEALIEEARGFEAEGRLQEAHTTYCRGLQTFLDIMPKVSDSEDAATIKAKIASYVTQVEQLKHRLDSQSGSGGGGSAVRHESTDPDAGISLNERPAKDEGGSKRERRRRRPQGGTLRSRSDHRNAGVGGEHERGTEAWRGSSGDRERRGHRRESRDGRSGIEVREAPGSRGKHGRRRDDGYVRSRSPGRGRDQQVFEGELTDAQATRTKAPPPVAPACLGGPVLRAKSGMLVRPF